MEDLLTERIPCPDGSKCIDPEDFCDSDGVKDCRDGWDQSRAACGEL